MDTIVAEARECVAGGDWDGLRARLHPYMHWQDAQVKRLRGRTHVMAALMTGTPLPVPSSYELRDGQIYRWTG